MSAVGYQENSDELDQDTKNMHRAIVSLMEELDAVNVYNQRLNVCSDPELAKILKHNRDEEKEHAAMLLEWIRRNDSVMEKELKDWLFSNKPFHHE